MTPKPEFTQAMHDWIVAEARAVAEFPHTDPERRRASRAVTAEAHATDAAQRDHDWHRAYESARLALVAAKEREAAETESLRQRLAAWREFGHSSGDCACPDCRAGFR